MTDDQKRRVLLSIGMSSRTLDDLVAMASHYLGGGVNLLGSLIVAQALNNVAGEVSGLTGVMEDIHASMPNPSSPT